MSSFFLLISHVTEREFGRKGILQKKKSPFFQFAAKAIHEREYESHMRGKKENEMVLLFFVIHSWYEIVAHAASLNVSS